MTTNTVVRMLPEHDKKAYLRELLIQLAKEEKTPTDIFEAKFGDVQEEEKEYLLVSGQASIDFTCSVGYDRKEEYFDQVRKYNSTTKSYYYETVKKTRTVTDWHPYSGSNSSRESSILGNSSDQSGYRSREDLLACYKSTKKENIVDVDEEVEVSPAAYNEGKRKCLGSCYVHASIPGDHVKDSHYEGEVEVDTVSVMKVTQYSISYEYDGKEYPSSAFASGDMRIVKDFPNASEDVTKEAKKAVAHFKYLAIGFLVVGVVLNILATFIGWWCVLGYGLAIASLVLYFVQRNKRMKEIYSIRQQQKKKSLIAALQRFGLEPLPLEEIENMGK